MSNHSSPDIFALNPYRHLKIKDPLSIRLSNDILRSDLHRIRSVVLDYGFINGAISRFVKHLADYCEQNGYSYTDRDKLINYVTNTCVLNLASAAGPTQSGPNPPQPSEDGRQPAQGVDTANKGAANVERAGRGKPAAKKGKSGKGK